MKVRTHAVARAAYERVAARRDAPATRQYGALAHKLPSMILQNGLAQATGFLLAKDKPEHRALLDDLRAVLHARGVTTARNGDDLHREIIGADLARILQLTRSALEASGWLKRYAQGVLRVDATGERTDTEADGADTRQSVASEPAGARAANGGAS